MDRTTKSVGWNGPPAGPSVVTSGVKDNLHVDIRYSRVVTPSGLALDAFSQFTLPRVLVSMGPGGTRSNTTLRSLSVRLTDPQRHSISPKHTEMRHVSATCPTQGSGWPDTDETCHDLPQRDAGFGAQRGVRGTPR